MPNGVVASTRGFEGCSEKRIIVTRQNKVFQGIPPAMAAGTAASLAVIPGLLRRCYLFSDPHHVPRGERDGPGFETSYTVLIEQREYTSVKAEKPLRRAFDFLTVFHPNHGAFIEALVEQGVLVEGMAR